MQGADAYMPLPINTRELLARIKNLVRRSEKRIEPGLKFYAAFREDDSRRASLSRLVNRRATFFRASIVRNRLALLRVFALHARKELSTCESQLSRYFARAFKWAVLPNLVFQTKRLALGFR